MDDKNYYVKNPDEYWSNLQKSKYIVVSESMLNSDETILIDALSNKCLPLLIDELNENYMYLLPKKYLTTEKKRSTYYQDNIKYITEYVKKHLNTKYMAYYLLNIMKLNNIKYININKILLITYAQDKSDILFEMCLIDGLLNHVKHNDLYVYDQSKQQRQVNYRFNKNINNLFTTYVKHHSVNIEQQIKEHSFDIIIVNGIYSQIIKPHMIAFINKYYKPHEIAIINYTDKYINTNRYINSAVCFSKYHVV
jgi:hypothetical protein